MNNHYSLPPVTPTSPYEKGDVLIQVLQDNAIAQWMVAKIEGENKIILQLIDKKGNFTNKYKVVSRHTMGSYIMDGLATRMLLLYKKSKIDNRIKKLALTY